MKTLFNTPTVTNPYGVAVNAINYPGTPVMTLNSDITPEINSIPYYNPLYPMRLPNPNSYINVNDDPTLKNQMTKYFYEEFMYWLAKNERYNKLYFFISVKNNNIIHEYDKDNKPDQKELKLKFLLNLFNSHDIFDLLSKFCKDNNVNLWDLKKDGVKQPLRNYIYVHIKKYLKKKVSKN